MNDQPPLILSIRQPWAWLILNGGKDIENRTWPTNVRGRVLIHAAKGMTEDEYQSARLMCHQACGHPVYACRMPGNSPFTLPRFCDLKRGGLVGEVEIIDCVNKSNSPWFVGPFGFVLRNPVNKPFMPLKGRLGFFRSQELEGW